MNFRELEKEYHRKEENFEKTNVPQILKHYDKIKDCINPYGYIASDTITEEKLKSIENMENAINSILEFLPTLRTFIEQVLVPAIIELESRESTERYMWLNDVDSDLILIEDIIEEIRGLAPSISHKEIVKDKKLYMYHCINIAEVSELFREVKYILANSVDLIEQKYDSLYIHIVQENEVVEMISTLREKSLTVKKYYENFVDSYNNFIGIKVDTDYEEETKEIDTDNLMYYLKDYIDVYLI